MNIRLHIEQLVLRGVELTPTQRRQLQASLETELTRLLAQGGLAPAMLHGAMMPDPARRNFHNTGSRDAALLGTQIAQSVYK